MAKEKEKAEKLGFEGLEKKVEKNYEKQEKSKKESKEIAQKVAGRVYWNKVNKGEIKRK